MDKLGNITWKQDYKLGNITIDLETSLLTWKHRYSLGNIRFDFEIS